MGKANPSLEPSMEEILASIRRIIADDGAVRETASARAERPSQPWLAQPALAGDGDEDDLDRAFVETGSEASDDGLWHGEADRNTGGDGEPAVAVAAPASDPAPAIEEPTAAVKEPFARQARAPATSHDPAVSEAADMWASAGHLAEPVTAGSQADAGDGELVSPATVATVNAQFGQLNQAVVSSSPRTIDDIVRDMLRPMLKQWLDDNLPGVVERLVRAEIERVTRGR
jgi:uncharacterized protein